ncbi:helix-turn-helix domain-containing protein [Roseomonas sp. CAU 1739]|uniref:helix-turn-helix domain-containing protein n=1 Tax=Roseomonas sp. CAU 1739 TaxID=3140364 RepID=UPI0038CF2FBF
MRLRRQLVGMSQKDLAAALRITCQQVQKLERGMNRISAGRLHDLAGVLDVPIGFFFEAVPSAPGGRADMPDGQPPAESHGETWSDLLHRRETLSLVRAYYTVTDAALRRRILDLVQSLAPPP